MFNRGVIFAFLLFLGHASADDLIDFPSDNSFLPKSWIAAPIQANVEPLKEELKADAERIVRNAIAKYPVRLREEFLNGVSIVGSLRFYDVGYGGTYMSNGKRIVLVYRAKFDDRGFEQRFHHEFSSILLKQNEPLFEKSRWTSSNPDGFTYRAAGVIEEKNGDRSEATRVLAEEQKKTGGSGSGLLRLNGDLMKQGFLTLYNRVSIEQDFNETAAHLFTNPTIWKYCAEFPRIDQKVDVLVDFYRELDPEMDRLYFRNLTKPDPVKPTP